MRALLITDGTQTLKVHGRYVEVYGLYQRMLNVDGVSIYTKAYVTTDNERLGQILLGPEELQLRRIGGDAMIEHDAVHIWLE